MITALRHLNGQSLSTLAGALSSGRLRPPYTQSGLQRYCPIDGAGAVAAEMQQLAADGLKPEHLGLMIEAIAAERAAHANMGDVIDLVWTGPEVPEMISRDTGVVVRELFAAARRDVLVAGFAVYQGREVFLTLAERMDVMPELAVTMYLNVQRHYTDTSTDEDLLRRFVRRFKAQEWPGNRLPRVYYDPRSLAIDPRQRACLHAKCIVIDRQCAFITSANFTRAAQARNIEVGLLIRSGPMATRLAEHFESLAAAQLLLPIPGLCK